MPLFSTRQKVFQGYLDLITGQKMTIHDQPLSNCVRQATASSSHPVFSKILPELLLEEVTEELLFHVHCQQVCINDGH